MPDKPHIFEILCECLNQTPDFDPQILCWTADDSLLRTRLAMQRCKISHHEVNRLLRQMS